jgi:serine/threonine protein phosphatase PrpC
VSRTIGDIHAKLEQFGGKEGVIISEPEITIIKITEDCDFMILGCDGIFDQMSNNDVADCVKMTQNEDIHSSTADAVNMIMKTAMLRKAIDNLTCIVLSFKSSFN